MKHQKSTRSFASRWGFILASVGSAVGMANVWGFPNKLGSNGGGAFLLIYLLFLFIFSYVGLPAEFAMGRRAATGTLGAYRNAWATRGETAGKVGGVLGWLPLVGSLCIAIGYAVIVTYVLKALVDSLTGTLMTADAAAWFSSFSAQPRCVLRILLSAADIASISLSIRARNLCTSSGVSKCSRHTSVISAVKRSSLRQASRHSADRGCRYSFSYSGATPSTIATQRKKLKYPVTRGKCR